MHWPHPAVAQLDDADALIRSIAQPHVTHILRANLLDVINRLNQVRHKLCRVLCCGEMPQARHRLVHSTRYLVRRLLRHVGRIGPVVFAREHVHGTALCVDGRDAGSAVPAAKVKVEVAMEDLYQFQYPNR